MMFWHTSSTKFYQVWKSFRESQRNPGVRLPVNKDFDFDFDLPLGSSDFQVKFTTLESIFNFRRSNQEHDSEYHWQWKASNRVPFGRFVVALVIVNIQMVFVILWLIEWWYVLLSNIELIEWLLLFIHRFAYVIWFLKQVIIQLSELFFRKLFSNNMISHWSSTLIWQSISPMCVHLFIFVCLEWSCEFLTPFVFLRNLQQLEMVVIVILVIIAAIVSITDVMDLPPNGNA